MVAEPDIDVQALAELPETGHFAAPVVGQALAHEGRHLLHLPRETYPRPVPGVPSRRPTGGRDAIPRPAARANVMAAPASRPAGLQERASRPGTGCRPGGPLHRGCRPAAGATLHRCQQPVGCQDTRGLFLAFLHDGRQAGVTPSRGRQPAQTSWRRRHRGRQACRKGHLAREPDADQVDRYIEAAGLRQARRYIDAGSRLDARTPGACSWRSFTTADRRA